MSTSPKVIGVGLLVNRTELLKEWEGRRPSTLLGKAHHPERNWRESIYGTSLRKKNIFK